MLCSTAYLFIRVQFIITFSEAIKIWVQCSPEMKLLMVSFGVGPFPELPQFYKSIRKFGLKVLTVVAF